ncbi:hypothetical protein GBAR_LOCUS17787 [Geodia barretti]|uniref:Fibronectin type-III domain-containing protein n=1 Tax=Geodia barretti TaxID=519541 RepID=A0AA35SLF7_GEOBA|nr:hypothetical protein GBAR_LOCUS17787 [Geodia barretti]
MITLSGLTNKTVYTVVVAARTSAGTGVYSQPQNIEIPDYVFFSLNGNIIPNHGYVAINDIGSTDNTALLCHTNRPPPNSGNSGGNWYAPDMTRINYDEINGVARNRGPTIVRLKRTTSTGTPPEGIYLCEIMDAAFTLQLVYIGVYNSGEGIMLYNLNEIWFLNVFMFGTLFRASNTVWWYHFHSKQ